MAVPTHNDIIALIEAREKVAYQKGWDDAFARMMAAANVATVPVSDAGVRDHRRIPPRKPERSIVQVILDIIKDQPGKRGADIFREAVNRVEGSDFKTMDRTGRTALARLKKRGKIRIRNKRWYPVTEITETTGDVPRFVEHGGMSVAG